MQFDAEITPDQCAILPMLMLWNGESEDGKQHMRVLSFGWLWFSASIAFDTAAP